MLRRIPYAQAQREAVRLRTVFTRWCRDHSYDAASEALERDWDRMITFYDFPQGALGAPTDYEPGGITLCCPQASDRCRQALQEGRSGHSGDLEDPDGRRTALHHNYHLSANFDSGAWVLVQGGRQRQWRRWRCRGRRLRISRIRVDPSNQSLDSSSDNSCPVGLFGEPEDRGMGAGY